MKNSEVAKTKERLKFSLIFDRTLIKKKGKNPC